MKPRTRVAAYHLLHLCLWLVVAGIVPNKGSGVAFAQTQSAPVDVIVAAHYPPLMIDTDATRPGFAVEVIQVAAARLGRDISVNFLPFQRAMHLLQSGEATFMPALFRNEEREDSFRWVAKIHSAELRFLTLNNQINSLDEAVAAGVIGVEEGSTGDRYLARFGIANVSRVKNPRMSALMLNAGRIETWFLTLPLANAVWRQLSLERELIAGDIIFELPVYLVSGLDVADEIALAYASEIKAMQDDGTMAELRAIYMN